MSTELVATALGGGVVVEGTDHPEERDRSWELHLKGTPLTKIARETGFSASLIKRWIEERYAALASRPDPKAAEVREGTLARLNLIASAAWGAFEKLDKTADVGGRGAGARHLAMRGYLETLLRVEDIRSRLEGVAFGSSDPGAETGDDAAAPPRVLRFVVVKRANGDSVTVGEAVGVLQQPE